MAPTSWRIAGTYFEACNCDAICPCRRVGGVSVGRSTYGLCFGALSWRIEEGRYGELELGGLNAAMAISFDDDEPGSPWSIVLYVDERGDEAQRAALADIFLGLPGKPWSRKPSHLLDVRARRIEIGERELRIGGEVTVRATRPVDTEETVTCVIPGHDRPGTEYYADELTVHDEPFDWELHGRCAFASDFAYAN